MSPRRILSALSALLTLSAAPALAEPAAEGRYLVILAQDGAFHGNLARLAGRPMVVVAEDGQAREVLGRLADAHGWNGQDRQGWRQDGFEAAARSVCAGDSAALVMLAGKDDPRLAQALGACRMRVIDLSDAVSRRFAQQTPDLRAASVAGTATLRLDTPTQVAAGRD
ncbi:hypothetical protein HHL28_00525 [Aerophototrophica crusticola]|uniref:Uncharacterized protein n=1 Tax=Aerophototrophica crusticola TaxID=1709002 RepID=A0A858R328_9PROT|nr:hypothetical protein HHL28_00525 [Rhodospirillaceae bacterium B3]